MYKKEVKKKGRTYIYYYHNVREQGRIRNICLGSNLKKAKERLYNIRNENYNLLDNAPEHNIYVGIGYIKKGYTNSNFSAESITALPLNSLVDDSNLEIVRFCSSKSLGGILNKKIPKCLEEVYEESIKCVSREISNLSSFKANLKIALFSTLLGDNFTSCPNLVRKENKPLCTFSSNRNFILCRNQVKSSFSKISGKVQSSPNMFSSQGRICFSDFFNSGTCFKHFQNQIYHDPSSFEGWLSMTDFAVNNNIFINFDSHKTTYDDEIFKSIENFILTTFSYVYKSIKDVGESPKNLILLQNLGEIGVNIIEKNV